MTSIQTNQMTNLLLATLPRNDQSQILANHEIVDLMLSEVLATHGDLSRYVYFPIDSLISVDGGSGLELGLIGNEGMLGIHLVLGVEVAPFRALVQVAGPALRMTAASFLRELKHYPALKRELDRYLYVLMSQLALRVACNRFHLVEERLARLLLMIRDRAHSEEFHVTHEVLAQMLGVRRVGVTKAAGLLQKQKVISYSRGNIKIHDIRGLQAESCGCYQIDREIYESILSHR